MKRRFLAFILAMTALLTILPMASVAEVFYEPLKGSPSEVNSFWDALPYPAENGDVTYKNGWTLGYRDLGVSYFGLYTQVSSIKYGIIGMNANGNVWTQGGGIYTDGTLAMPADGRLNMKTTAAMQIRYTATHNGTIKYSFDRLRFVDFGKATPNPTFFFQLLVNDEKVWPASGDWFEYTNAYVTTNPQESDVLADFLTKVNLPESIDVKAGDTVDLLIKRDNDEVLRISPCVQYTELKDNPVISQELKIGESITLDIAVDLDPATTRAGAKAGLYYWTEKPEEINLVTAKKLEATSVEGSTSHFVRDALTSVDMLEELWVLPYTYVEGNREQFFGALTLCSVVECAKNLYEAKGTDAFLKEYLREFVNYGANAEIFFNANGDVAPNSFLSPADRESTEREGNDVWAQSSDGTTGVNITHASLVLDNQVGLKFVAPLAYGVDTYKLQIATKADFSDMTEIEMEQTTDGTGYRAIHYIDFDDITTTYYVRVTDGSGYGNTLTYSAESYIVRRNAVTSDDAEYYLLTSLLSLGYAADALQ